MIAVALAGVLGMLSAIHVAWAVGRRGPSTAVVPHVDGRPAFTPTPLATMVVAVGLAGAALVALVCGRIVAPPVAWLPWRGAGIALGLVFLVRAIGDFRLAGFFKRVRGTSFARWDTWLYSPLCVALGVAFLRLALLRCPAMAAPYRGGCLCATVRYRIDGEPLTLYACHCTDCQRRTGTAFALSLVVRRDALVVETGTPVPYAATLPEGRLKQGRMCGTCGTRLWGEPAGGNSIAVVQPGTLDETSWLRPVAHIWTRSAHPWITLPSDVAVFPAGPPEFRQLVDLWRAR